MAHINSPSGFVRSAKGGAQACPPGCSKTPGRSLVTSTGCDDLDAIVANGGLPLGAVLGIVEPAPCAHSTLLVRMFLAAAYAHSHKVLLVAPQYGRNLLDELPPAIDPAAAGAPSDERRAPADNGDKLRIAWRYQQQNSAAEAGDRHGSMPAAGRYDLQSADFVPFDHFAGRCQPELVDLTDFDVEACLARVRRLVEAHTESGDGRVLRLAVHLYGSPHWGSDAPSLVRFAAALRLLLRSAPAAVGCVTVPQATVSDTVWRRARLHCDALVRLMPFDGDAGGVYGKQHGRLVVERLCTPLGSLAPHRPANCTDLVYRARASRFAIDVLRLPPAFAADGNNANAAGGRFSGKASGSGKALEF